MAMTLVNVSKRSVTLFKLSLAFIFLLRLFFYFSIKIVPQCSKDYVKIQSTNLYPAIVYIPIHCTLGILVI